jgi:hypothetical protein
MLFRIILNRMKDEDFLTAFESGTLADLPHRAHVRIACLYLDRGCEAEALERLVAGLRRFAAAKGHAHKFHYTITRAWLALVVNARLEHPAARDVDELLIACPRLADARALTHYYSSAVLSSAAARADWVPPDLMAIGRGV